MTRIRIKFIRIFFLLFVHAIICLTPCLAMDLLDDFPSQGIILRHDTKIPIGTINDMFHHAFLPTGTPINEIPEEVSRQRMRLGLPPQILLSEQEKFLQEFPWKILRNQFVRSPMPGRVVKICVKKGDAVEKRSCLAVVEAMKMEMALHSRLQGTIKHIFYEEGEIISSDSMLVSLLPRSTEWETIHPNTSPHHKTQLSSFFPWMPNLILEDSPSQKGRTVVEEKKATEEEAKTPSQFIETSGKISPTSQPLPVEASITHPSPVSSKEEVPFSSVDLMDDITVKELPLAEKTQDKEDAHIPPQISKHEHQTQNILTQDPFIKTSNKHCERPQQSPAQDIDVSSPFLTQVSRGIFLPSTAQTKQVLPFFKPLTASTEHKGFRRSKTLLSQDKALLDLSCEDLKGHSGLTLLPWAKELCGLMALGVLLLLLKANYIIRSYFLMYLFPNTVSYPASTLATIKWLQAGDFNQQTLHKKKTLCNINSPPQKRFKIA